MRSSSLFIHPLIICCTIAFGISIAMASQGYDGDGEWCHYLRQAPQGDILSVYALPEGKVWVDTEKAFHVYDGRKWELISFNSDILGEDPPFISDGNGIFYFIHDKQLHVYDMAGESIESYDTDTVHYPVSGAFSSTGDLYIASNHFTQGGLYCFSNGTVTKIRDGRTRSVAVDSDDQIWITHIDPDEDTMKILVLQADTWTDVTENISEIFNPNNDTQMTVIHSPDGDVWVNNEGDFAVYSNGSWTTYDGGTGVAPRYLQFDREGNVWGYGERKLYHLKDDNTWEISHVMKRGISTNPWFIASTDDNNIWITDYGYLHQYVPEEDSLWLRIESPYDLASDTVTCLAYTSDNRLVCGHGIETSENDAGFSVLDGREWYNHTKFNYKKVLNVFEMALTDVEDIIMYSDSGIRIFDGATWTVEDTLRVNPAYDVLDIRDMLLDESENLWIGSFFGLIKYDFTVRPDTLRPPVETPYEDAFPITNLGFDRLFIDVHGLLYMQNEVEGIIIRYDESKVNEKRKWDGLYKNISLTDFAVDRDAFIYYTLSDYLYKYKGSNQFEIITSSDTREKIFLENASFCNIDEDERIWASGDGNTGYIDENGVWNRIPELSEGGATEWAWSNDGRIAFNSFRWIDKENGEKEYLGVYEYRPSNVISGVAEEPLTAFSIQPNYPNPFNASTIIPFELTESGQITITIYNVAGQKVRTLVDDRYSAGTHSVRWAADNDSGEHVASGLYFYRIHTPASDGVGKMLYLR